MATGTQREVDLSEGACSQEGTVPLGGEEQKYKKEGSSARPKKGRGNKAKEGKKD